MTEHKDHDHDHHGHDHHGHDHQHKKKRHWPAIIISLACALIFIISSMTFTAPDSEYVVVTRFGSYQEVASEGLNFKFPYPMEDTVRLDKRIQHFESALTQTALKDVKNLLVSVSAEWRIKQGDDGVKKFLETVTSLDNAKTIMKRIIGTPTGNIFPKYKLSEVYTITRSQHKLDEIRQKILLDAQEIADDYGIEIINVGFTQSAFAPAATESVFKMMISERKRKAEELRNSGREKAEKIIRTANADATEKEAVAKIEAEKIRRAADLAATDIYKTFKNPELLSFLTQLDSLALIMGKKTQVILDMNTPPFNLLKGDYLDKQEIKKNK